MSLIKKIFLLYCIFIISSCGGSSSGGSTTPPPDNTPPPNNTPPEEPEVTLASLQAAVFEACTRCHTGSTAPRGLSFETEQLTFDNLVDVAADEVPNLMLVNPGNPDESYLVQKIEGAESIVGSRMPLGGPFLSDELIQDVRDWITNGAPRTGTGANAAKISQYSVSSKNDTTVFNLHFSKAIQPDSISESAVNVYLIADDTRWLANRDDYKVRVETDNLAVEINNTANVDSIELHVNDPAQSAILDAEGRVLDGDNDNLDSGKFIHLHTL